MSPAARCHERVAVTGAVGEGAGGVGCCERHERAFLSLGQRPAVPLEEGGSQLRVVRPQRGGELDEVGDERAGLAALEVDQRAVAAIPQQVALPEVPMASPAGSRPTPGSVRTRWRSVSTSAVVRWSPTSVRCLSSPTTVLSTTFAASSWAWWPGSASWKRRRSLLVGGAAVCGCRLALQWLAVHLGEDQGEEGGGTVVQHGGVGQCRAESHRVHPSAG
jgi:hypothetical protein